jgi:hypothetical protein
MQDRPKRIERFNPRWGKTYVYVDRPQVEAP